MTPKTTLQTTIFLSAELVIPVPSTTISIPLWVLERLPNENVDITDRHYGDANTAVGYQGTQIQQAIQTRLLVTGGLLQYDRSR